MHLRNALYVAILAWLLCLSPLVAEATTNYLQDSMLLEARIYRVTAKSLEVSLIYNGTRVGMVTVSFLKVGGMDLVLVYDIVVRVNVYHNILAREFGFEPKIVVILDYELKVNNTMVEGYRLSVSPSVSYSLMRLAGLSGVERVVPVNISRLNLVVNIYHGNWSLVAYRPLDLLGMIEENGLPTGFFAGSSRIYFWVEKKIVDPYWVTYYIHSPRMTKAGVIKVTSQGPFNYSTAVRVYYDTRDPLLARYAVVKLVADVVVSGGLRHIVLEMKPGEDIVMPPQLEAALGEAPLGIKELLVVIDVGYYKMVLNVTRDVGVIIFNPIKPVTEHFRLEEVYVRELDRGVVLAVYRLPFEVSPHELSIRFRPDKGGLEPLFMVGAIEFDGLTGEERLRVYLIFPGEGEASGTVVVQVERAPGKVSVAEAHIGPLKVRGLAYKFEPIEPTYSTFIGGKNGLKSIADILREEGLLRSYEEFGGASFLYIGLGARDLTPMDAVLVKVKVSYSRITPTTNTTVIVVPVYEYVEWSPQVDSLIFLVNGTNQGRTAIGAEGTVTLTYVIPASSLAGYGIEGMVEGRSYPTINLKGLGLVFLNAKDLKVESVEAYILRHNLTGEGAGYSLAAMATAALVGAATAVLYKVGFNRRNRDARGS